MKRFMFFFSLGIMLIVSSTVWAGVPKQINFQGILTNSGGTPLADTMVSVEFRIYTALAGGESKWVETQSVTTDDQGRFNVTLGVNSPIEDTVFKDTLRYLSVNIESAGELMPRTKLVSVSFANRVSTIDGAKGGTISGNTSIQSDLTVNGIIDATGMSSKVRFHYNDIADFPSAVTYHGMFAHAHNQGAAYYAHAAAWVRLADSLHFHSSLAASDLSPNPALSVDTAGKVGIGTTTPNAKLEVLNSTSSGSILQGVNGLASNSSTGGAFGGIFSASSAGSGTKIGVRGNASSAATGAAYGVYGEADNSSSGQAYGGYFNVTTGGAGGIGAHYGVQASSFGLSGPVYGGYFFTDTTGTGTKYGVYATAPTAEGDAGYFAGNATVTDTLFASNVSSLSPLRLQTGGTTRMYIDDVSGNVGIGTDSPQGALDVSSTTGALIVPRMTTAQRDALTAVNGMIIYNTTTNQFNFYENGSWVTK